MQEIVPVLRVAVDLHQLDEELTNGVLLQAVNASIAVLVWQYQAKGRVEVVSNFGAPSRHEALDDMAPLLMRRHLGGPMGARL